MLEKTKNKSMFKTCKHEKKAIQKTLKVKNKVRCFFNEFRLIYELKKTTSYMLLKFVKINWKILTVFLEHYVNFHVKLKIVNFMISKNLRKIQITQLIYQQIFQLFSSTEGATWSVLFLIWRLLPASARKLGTLRLFTSFILIGIFYWAPPTGLSPTAFTTLLW